MAGQDARETAHIHPDRGGGECLTFGEKGTRERARVVDLAGQGVRERLAHPVTDTATNGVSGDESDLPVECFRCPSGKPEVEQAPTGSHGGRVVHVRGAEGGPLGRAVARGSGQQIAGPVQGTEARVAVAAQRVPLGFPLRSEATDARR